MSNVFSEVLSSSEFKEEYIVAETQARLAALLEDKGVSRAELARRLDVSRARISQIFSDEAQNFTLRLLIRSYLALDEEPIVVSRSEYEALQGNGAKRATKTSDEDNCSVAGGIAEELIAKLLEANVGVSTMNTTRGPRDSVDGDAWVSASPNVVSIRKYANG